jgi:hypothetical protein
VTHAYFNWENEQYQSFMVHFMQKLETIYIQKDQVILGELEDVQTVTFMAEGSVDLGYDINRVTKYVTRLTGSLQLGCFECSYNRRCQLIYKASRSCDYAHFIRKKTWLAIGNEFPLFFKMMK